MNTVMRLSFLACLLLTRSLPIAGAETYDFSAAKRIWGLCKIEFTDHLLSSKVKMRIIPLPGMPFCFSNITIECPAENEEAFLFTPGRIFFKVGKRVVSLLELICYSKYQKIVSSERKILLEKALDTFFKEPRLTAFTYAQMLQVPAQSTPFVPLFISDEPWIEIKAEDYEE